jgi:hypothetical protein
MLVKGNSRKYLFKNNLQAWARTSFRLIYSPAPFLGMKKSEVFSGGAASLVSSPSFT